MASSMAVPRESGWVTVIGCPCLTGRLTYGYGGRHGPSTAGPPLLAAPDGAGQVGHRHAHGVAVFGPGTVIVAHLIAEDLLQREPGVAGALADAAVGDDRLAAVDAYRRVDLLQLLGRFEGAVGRHRLAPGHVHRAGYVAGAHSQLLHALRGEHLAAVLVRRTDIHQLHIAALLGGRQHVRQVGAQVLVRRLDRDLAGRRGAGAIAQAAALGFPLGAAAVEQLDV